MSKRIVLVAGLALAAGIAAAVSQPAVAAFTVQEPQAPAPRRGADVQLADARSYHHCHNMPRRTRCHSTGRLPTNWPPNSNTPATSSLRERHADQVRTCADGRRGWFCWR